MDDIGLSNTTGTKSAKLPSDGVDGSTANIVSADRAGTSQIDASVEKRLRRKLDRRVVTLVFLAYLLAFLDRSNIGNAETAGMSKDLGFDDAHFQARRSTL